MNALFAQKARYSSSRILPPGSLSLPFPPVAEPLGGYPYAGDVRIVLFLQTTTGNSLTEARVAEVRSLFRQQVSPRHGPAFILETSEIPYTLSGKKVELAVREVIAGQNPANEKALANPAALLHFRNRPELQ